MAILKHVTAEVVKKLFVLKEEIKAGQDPVVGFVNHYRGQGKSLLEARD